MSLGMGTSRLQNPKLGPVSLSLFLQLVDPDIEFLVTSPAKCLRACCHAPSVITADCKQAHIKGFFLK